MKGGAENRKKTILLGVLLAVGSCGILYNLYAVFGGPSTPPPTIAPTTSAPAPVLRNGTTAARGANSPNSTGSTNSTNSTNSTSTGRTGAAAGAAVPGVAAGKLASTSASLDPTLDQAAMLRTESLVYAGSGRNIFSANYVPTAIVLPTHMPPPRPGPVSRPFPQPPPGPPPPPPIPLRFFGTAQRTRGVKQAFLLSGEDVYVAGAGDIVAKRYKVDQILSSGVQVTDLVSNSTQILPMQQQ